MGRGIALNLLIKGLNVSLMDINDKQLELSRIEIEKRLNRLELKGEVENLQNLLTKITYIKQIEDVSSSKPEIILEAVSESFSLKRSLFRELQSTFPSTPIATNTSSLSITDLTEDLPVPNNVIGMHWFNPPILKSLIEVIPSKFTSKSLINSIMQFAKEIGKSPILVKDVPGFATSRLGVVLGLEAIRMLEQGVASPQDIDTAMVLGYGFPMGPLELTDYVGLDTRLSIAEYINSKSVSPAFDIPHLLKKMVQEGKLGRKSGQGFYSWREGKKEL